MSCKRLSIVAFSAAQGVEDDHNSAKRAAVNLAENPDINLLVEKMTKFVITLPALDEEEVLSDSDASTLCGEDVESLEKPVVNAIDKDSKQVK